MARKRMIDPSFWMDEKLGECSRDERLLFMGLISNADDEGYGRANPKLLNATIFPYDNIRIDRFKTWLDHICKLGLVVLYTSEEQAYYFLPGFSKHQTINKPSKSTIPKPRDDESEHYGSTTVVLPPKRKERNKRKEVEENACAREDDDGNNLELPPEMRDNDYAKLASVLDGFFGRPCTSMEIDTAEFLIEQHGKQWFEQALRESSDAGAKNLAYVRAKLDAWKARGSPEKDRQAKGQEESRYKPL